jgi:hypothetical protein
MTIKAELKGKYKEYLHNNINSFFEEPEKVTRKDGKVVNMPSMPNSYVLAILLVTELVGEALDDGETPEEAEKKMNGYHLTGFMAGAVAETIAGFHPRGDEFRKWWNKQYGVSEDKKVL